MRICGIIAEYNPFHNGHRYHVEEALKLTGADTVIAIMSGNFVQRGEPAIIDKWTRTKIALENKIDCVFELPTYFATASAQYFAMASIHILERLGVDCFCFGSEIGDIDLLKQIARYMNSSEYENSLKFSLEQGNSYSKAMNFAISTKFSGITLKSNDYLGISYINEVIKNDYKIQPYCIKRVANEYNAEYTSLSDGGIASATSIRNLMCRRSVNYDLLSDFLPENSMSLIRKYPVFVDLEMFHQIFRAIFIREYPKSLHQIRGMREGIENRIFGNLVLTQDLSHAINRISSRRYPNSSISRLIINTILGICEVNEVEKYMDYVRILGYNEYSGVLKEIKTRSDLFFITNMARDMKKYQKKNILIDIDVRASRIYDMVNPIFGLHSEFLNKIIINREMFKLNYDDTPN